MRKSYRLQDLECANCATKMEDEIAKLEGVNKATVSFMTSRLTLDVQDGCLEDVVHEAQDICTKYEPDCKIVVPA